MLTVYIQNVHTENNIAKYKYLVFINDVRIEQGKIAGHDRDDGWAKLVKKIAEQHIPKEKKKKVGKILLQESKVNDQIRPTNKSKKT